MTTYHESAVPGLDLLFSKVGILHKEVHVFLRQLLAAAGTHSGGFARAPADHVTRQSVS